MNQIDVAMHAEAQQEINPFSVQLDMPLHNQGAVRKLGPKFNADGDIGRAGTYGIGDG